MPQTVQPQANRRRSIPQILSALSRTNLGPYVGKQSRISKIYQDFQQFISLDELKQVKQFLDTKSAQAGDAEVASSPDFIDMDDLIEAVKHKHNMERQAAEDSEMEQRSAPSNSKQRPQHDFYGQQRNDPMLEGEIEAIQKKMKRLLREKDDDAEFFSSKIRQLKRQLKDANLEKGELTEQVERLENQKQRQERFYKDKMGMTIDGKSTFGQTAGTSGELSSEVNIIARRIEFLEEQSDQRSKEVQSEHDPCRREIARLNEELEMERASRAKQHHQEECRNRVLQE